MIYSSVSISDFFKKKFKGFTFETYFCLHGLAQWLTSDNLLRYLPFKDPLLDTVDSWLTVSIIEGLIVGILLR